MSSYPSYYTPFSYGYGYRPTPNGTLNDPKFSLRKIDAAAILTCLLLLRIAFAPSDITSGSVVNFGDSNIGASMELQFYSAFQSRDGHVARPVPIDIDGDGVVDALVVPEFTNEEDVLREKEAEEVAATTLKSAKRSSGAKKDSGDTNSTMDASAWGRGRWGIRVLNLKPLHSRNEENEGSNDGPFAPRTMFLSPLLDSKSSSEATYDSNAEDIYPVKLLSVQIPIQRTKLGEEERSRQRHKKADPSSTVIGYGTNSAIPPKDDANKEYDRKRHYFCGRDWHHASQSCHKHCGGGSSTECGEGETCYADTPCDAMLPLETSSKDANENEETDLALTVRGTLPGITTIWSDGGVTLHAITADIPVNVDPKHEHRGKKERQRKKKPELEMRQLWRVFPLDTASGSKNRVSFEELGLTYESGAIYGVAEETVNGEDGSKIVKQNQIGSHGAILLGGRYTAESVKTPKVSFHALDALTGALLWELGNPGLTSSKRGDKKTESEFTVPIIHTTSSARRRSHLPVKDVMDSELDNENSFVEGDDVMTTEECMAHFRHSVFDEANGALPHEFWEGDNGIINVGRFERMKKSPRKKSRALNKKSQLIQKDLLIGQGSLATSGSRQIIGTMGSSRGGTNTGHWQTDFLHRAIPKRMINQPSLKMGKPNVVMFHGRDGLAVMSLKNGSPVCHISLVDNTLYADVDKDGIVDVIQVVTPSDESHSGDVQNLIDRINKSEGVEDGHVGNRADPVFCHALVTSGLPPREEIFTAPLCLGGVTPSTKQMRIRAAPPLLVESSLRWGNDIIFAINNGVIVRYDSNGREVWRKKAAKDGTPSWHHATALLARVQFGVIKSHSSVSASSRHNQHRPGSPVRPILLSGESGAVVISPAGKVLSHVTYPQPAVIQPLLTDLNGDGTDDLLVVSKDALWGYRIVVETGRSGFFSIVVVTLVVGVALSALMHKTNQTARRSMDL